MGLQAHESWFFMYMALATEDYIICSLTETWLGESNENCKNHIEAISGILRTAKEKALGLARNIQHK
jgi:hypothetical protein